MGHFSDPRTKGMVIKMKYDTMLISAVEAVVEAQTATTVYLQRCLEVGYVRAAKLIDAMEELGIVTPPDGERRRRVIMTREQFLLWRTERENG